MKKILYIFIILTLITSSIFAEKERSRRNKKSKDSIIQLIDSFTFEDVAHDLFLSVSEDMGAIEKLSDDIDEITTELAKMLPRA